MNTPFAGHMMGISQSVGVSLFRFFALTEMSV